MLGTCFFLHLKLVMDEIEGLHTDLKKIYLVLELENLYLGVSSIGISVQTQKYVRNNHSWPTPRFSSQNFPFVKIPLFLAVRFYI